MTIITNFRQKLQVISDWSASNLKNTFPRRVIKLRMVHLIFY